MGQVPVVRYVAHRRRKKALPGSFNFADTGPGRSTAEQGAQATMPQDTALEFAFGRR